MLGKYFDKIAPSLELSSPKDKLSVKHQQVEQFVYGSFQS